MSPDWNPKWSDWQNMVWQKLCEVDKRTQKLEVFRWKIAGSVVTVVTLIEVAGQFIRGGMLK